MSVCCDCCVRIRGSKLCWWMKEANVLCRVSPPGLWWHRLQTKYVHHHPACFLGRQPCCLHQSWLGRTARLALIRMMSENSIPCSTICPASKYAASQFSCAGFVCLKNCCFGFILIACWSRILEGKSLELCWKISAVFLRCWYFFWKYGLLHLAAESWIVTLAVIKNKC